METFPFTYFLVSDNVLVLIVFFVSSNVVVGGIMYLGCSSVCLSVCASVYPEHCC